TRAGCIGDADAGHCIVEFLAILTKDGLDEEVESAVCPARDFGTVTAPGTLKPIRTAHPSFGWLTGVCLLPASSRTASTIARNGRDRRCNGCAVRVARRAGPKQWQQRERPRVVMIKAVSHSAHRLRTDAPLPSRRPGRGYRLRAAGFQWMRSNPG